MRGSAAARGAGRDLKRLEIQGPASFRRQPLQPAGTNVRVRGVRATRPGSAHSTAIAAISGNVTRSACKLRRGAPPGPPAGHLAGCAASVAAEDRAARSAALRAAGAARPPRSFAPPFSRPRMYFLPCRFDRTPYVIHTSLARRRRVIAGESLVRHALHAGAGRDRPRGTAIALRAARRPTVHVPQPLHSWREGGTMQRKTFLLATAMLLTVAAAAAAQSADENQYSQGSDATVNQQSTTPAQTPSTSTPADQQTIPADPSTTTSSELPKTASPLPLMGLGGLASLAAGAWLNRSRRRAERRHSRHPASRKGAGCSEFHSGRAGCVDGSGMPAWRSAPGWSRSGSGPRPTA